MKRDDDVVGEAASPPRSDHPDRYPEQERDEKRDADEKDRVRERPADDLRDRRGVVRARDAEVEVGDPVEVDDVVLPDRVVPSPE
jgi:hypothetical protein